MNLPRIVLIEDNPGDVELVKLALRENGIAYALTEFECGRDAVDILCAETDDVIVPDAILLDLNTPQTDGFEVLQKLRDCPRLSRVPSQC